MKILPIALCLLLAAIRPGWAVTCTTAVTPMAFGAYNPLIATPNDSVATVGVTCTTVVSLFVTYTVALSAGSSGSYAMRKLLSGTAGLQYQLYTNAGRTAVWGDGTGGTGTMQGGYLLAALAQMTNTFTAYGRIVARQNVPAGTYADTILVTVTF